MRELHDTAVLLQAALDDRLEDVRVETLAGSGPLAETFGYEAPDLRGLPWPERLAQTVALAWRKLLLEDQPQATQHLIIQLEFLQPDGHDYLPEEAQARAAMSARVSALVYLGETALTLATTQISPEQRQRELSRYLPAIRRYAKQLEDKSLAQLTSLVESYARQAA
jgi:hypothetical protein